MPALYREKYFDFNVYHFREKLREEQGLRFSYTWVKLVLQGDRKDALAKYSGWLCGNRVRASGRHPQRGLQKQDQLGKFQLPQTAEFSLADNRSWSRRGKPRDYMPNQIFRWNAATFSSWIRSQRLPAIAGAPGRHST